MFKNIYIYTYAFMHACLRAYAYACAYACMCAYIHTYIHTCLHACMLTYIHTDLHSHIHTWHTYVHTYKHTYTVSVYTYIYTCMHMHVCIMHMCIGISRPAELLNCCSFTATGQTPFSAEVASQASPMVQQPQASMKLHQPRSKLLKWGSSLLILWGP